MSNLKLKNKKTGKWEEIRKEVKNERKKNIPYHAIYRINNAYI